MVEIIPAIMPKNIDDLKQHVSRVYDLVPLVQVDLCDGNFVQKMTWPFHESDTQSLEDILNEREGMPYWDQVYFELDIMAYDAMENFENYVRMGPRRIIFHLEAMKDKDEFKDFLEGIDLYTREIIEIGIAINTTTPIEEIFPYVSLCDFVQCMGIAKIGMQGEPFDERVLEHIGTLREKYPDVVIAVDGGVNGATAEALVEKGANRLVMGSAIFESNDILETIQAFKEALS